jgi:pimeloyl-ACP methyl ester carboxylesterase
VSHLELDWQSADVRRFWEGVANDHTLIRYDRLGVGMSDRTVRDFDLTLDGEVAALRTQFAEDRHHTTETLSLARATGPDRVDGFRRYFLSQNT